MPAREAGKLGVGLGLFKDQRVLAWVGIVVAVLAATGVSTMAAGRAAGKPADVGRCRLGRGSTVVAKSGRTLVYLGRLSVSRSTGMNMQSVIACWKPTGQQTRFGTQRYADLDFPVGNNLGPFALAGRFAAYVVSHGSAYQQQDFHFRLEVVDVEHRKLRGCVSLPPGMLYGPIAVSPHAAVAFVGRSLGTGSPFFAYALTLADSRGITVLASATAERNVFSRLAISATRVSWREDGHSHSVSVHGGARIPARCAASDVRPIGGRK